MSQQLLFCNTTLYQLPMILSQTWLYKNIHIKQSLFNIASKSTFWTYLLRYVHPKKQDWSYPELVKTVLYWDTEINTVILQEFCFWNNCLQNLHYSYFHIYYHIVFCHYQTLCTFPPKKKPKQETENKYTVKTTDL